MFQKSLLKNFIKSFNRPHDNDIIKLVNKDKFIAEDANGAEFISLLSKFLNWDNCVREVKNNTDMKKADGVVYNKENNPIAIVELKSSDKKISNRDIIAQAFRYKNEKPTCKYVIISNFKKLDIYSDSSDICHSIDMTISSESSYEELYALLNQSSLELDEIHRLKSNSKTQDEITKEIYKEYSNFRFKLLNNLIENNTELSREEIFECANKLLDRYMFILFAEDRGLIPANSIDAIIKQYQKDQDWGEDTPLYEYYKKYFQFIDVGNSKVKIPKYNGNLFKEDANLESLVIDDHIIKDDLSSLSAYDFSDDVDVEVLGHIFEQSLNDLEQIKESLFTEHKIVNTRKKDGVFYTPKFVTEYIINNTVAKLCEEKKEALKLFKELKETKKNNEKRRDALQSYIVYLSSLKIVDPACGSGAFLTACFRYLLSEHKWTQKELAKAGAGLFENHNIDKEIIENNLFGVDINSASVGIAKLSLWLQTAKRDRPLSDLMNNIKCANSLLSDWNELFPDIMTNGGFDCVIGNPPYIGEKGRKDIFRPIKEVFKERYETNSDIFYFFFMKSIDILKEDGNFGFITTNYFLTADGAVKLRKELKERTAIYNIINFNEMKLFESALGQHNIITIFKKTTKTLDTNIINVISPDNTTQEQLFKNSDKVEVFTVKSNELYDGNKNYIRVSKQGNSLENVFSKMISHSKYINEICFVNTGFDSSADKVTKANIKKSYDIIPNNVKLNDGIFILNEEEYKKIKPEDEIVYKCYKSTDISRYSSKKWRNIYVIWTDRNVDINKYPNIKKHLEKYKKILEYKITNMGETLPWYAHDRARIYDVFGNKDKIIFPYRSKLNIFSYSNEEYFASRDVLYLRQKDTNFNIKYLLALLNSRLYYTWLYYKGKRKGETLELYVTPMSQVPIKNISQTEQEPFRNLVDTIISSKEKIAKYNKHFESLNAVEKIEIKEEIEKLETLVDISVAQIDQMVYILYELSEEEIALVEGGDSIIYQNKDNAVERNDV